MGDIVSVDFKSEAIDRNIEANCAAFIVAEVLELPIEVLRHPLLIEAVEAARVH